MKQTPAEKRAFDMGLQLKTLLSTRHPCDEDACLQLIVDGANTKIMDTNGYSLLFYAMTAPAPRVFEKLLADETDVNRRLGSDKISLLLFATCGGNIRALQQLIDRKADVNTTNSRGHTPLIAATLNNHPETLKLLLKAGANPMMQDMAGKTALDHAREMKRTKIEPVLAEAVKNHNALATARAIQVKRPLRIKPPKL
jgi:ankyrin repeat protein